MSGTFDKTKVYEKDIAPKIKEVIASCCDNGIPCYVALAISDNGKETKYVASSITPTFLDIKLSEDRFALLGRTLHSVHSESNERVSGRDKELPGWVKHEADNGKDY